MSKKTKSISDTYLELKNILVETKQDHILPFIPENCDEDNRIVKQVGLIDYYILSLQLSSFYSVKEC